MHAAALTLNSSGTSLGNNAGSNKGEVVPQLSRRSHYLVAAFGGRPVVSLDPQINSGAAGDNPRVPTPLTEPPGYTSGV